MWSVEAVARGSILAGRVEIDIPCIVHGEMVVARGRACVTITINSFEALTSWPVYIRSSVGAKPDSEERGVREGRVGRCSRSSLQPCSPQLDMGDLQTAASAALPWSTNGRFLSASHALYWASGEERWSIEVHQGLDVCWRRPISCEDF